MKNYVQRGQTVTLTAPYAVVSGAGALVGTLFGVANGDVASGASGEFDVEGVFDLPCLSTDTPAMGAKLYWDDTNKRLTTTLTSNTLVGVALVAKANGVALVRVRLNGAAV